MIDIENKVVDFKRNILTLIDLLNNNNFNNATTYQIKKIISLSSSIDKIENIINVNIYYSDNKNIKDKKDSDLYEITNKEITNINLLFEETSKLVDEIRNIRN